ncbi:hypothetical protein L1887_40525 [Cichorium endivia]|nr:hypothetical protein L1887_40525 [Cichorium endivia]
MDGWLSLCLRRHSATAFFRVRSDADDRVPVRKVCYVNVEVDGGDGDTDTRRSRGHEGKKRDGDQVDGIAAWWWGVDDSERRDWVERDDVDVGVNLSRFWPGRSGFGRKAGWGGLWLGDTAYFSALDCQPPRWPRAIDAAVWLPCCAQSGPKKSKKKARSISAMHHETPPKENCKKEREKISQIGWARRTGCGADCEFRLQLPFALLHPSRNVMKARELSAQKGRPKESLCGSMTNVCCPFRQAVWDCRRASAQPAASLLGASALPRSKTRSQSPIKR